jgi:hypothetical protein
LIEVKPFDPHRPGGLGDHRVRGLRAGALRAGEHEQDGKAKRAQDSRRHGHSPD